MSEKRPIVTSARYVSEALKKATDELGFNLSPTMLQSLRHHLVRELDSFVVLNNQAVLFLIEKFRGRKHEADSTRWCLEELAEAVELRGLSTEAHAKILAKYLSEVTWCEWARAGDLAAFNYKFEVGYVSWEAAARAILEGQAPQGIDDESRIWAVVSKFRDKLIPKKL